MKITKKQREDREGLNHTAEAWEARRIEKLPELERTPEEAANLKAHKYAVFLLSRRYDYQDDWDEQK